MCPPSSRAVISHRSELSSPQSSVSPPRSWILGVPGPCELTWWGAFKLSRVEKNAGEYQAIHAIPKHKRSLCPLHCSVQFVQLRHVVGLDVCRAENVKRRPSCRYPWLLRCWPMRMSRILHLRLSLVLFVSNTRCFWRLPLKLLNHDHHIGRTGGRIVHEEETEPIMRAV